MRLLSSVGLRRLRSVLVLSVVAAGVCVMSAAPAPASMASAASPSSVKIPANFAYVDSVKAGRCYWGIGVEFPTVPKAISYTIDYYDALYHAWEATGTGVPIPVSDDLGHGMNYLGITGGGGPAPCDAGDASEGGRFTKPIKAWAHFPGKAPTTGVIEGVITDEDGNPFAGAIVTASGPKGATAVSGPGGLYYMTVDAGSYRVVPEDTSVKKSTATPTDRTVSVPKGGSAEADFKINSGLQVTMDLSTTTAPASGFAIVKGAITTTRYGKPAPGVTVQLDVDQTDPGAALTTAPKVAVCGAGGRIWPEGNLTDLDGKAVNVVTDATGRYDFTLTVGTVPGSWSLDAWAFTPEGKLDTNLDATDTKVLTVSSVTPTTLLGNFLTSLENLKGQPYASQLNPQNPVNFSYTLAAWAATESSLNFSGLSFSVGSGADGQDVVIAPATTQFDITSKGELKRSSSLDNSLIVDPQEWTGNALPKSIADLSLNTAMQGGGVHYLPTVGQWVSGAHGIKGWSLKPQTLSIAFTTLAWWGWAYPPPGTDPSGYCQ